MQECDAVVCSKDELVVRVIQGVRNHLHLVDHAQLIEEAIANWLELFSNLEQVKLTRVLSCQNKAVWSFNFTNTGLGSESRHLCDFLTNALTLAVLETEIHVPLEKMSLVASCKDIVAMLCNTEWHLPFSVQINDYAEVET